MAKSREKVNQQLGFWDVEVTKPDHDAVCLWAYKNAETIFRAACPEMFDRPWMTDEVYIDNQNNNDTGKAMAKTFAEANPRPAPRITKKTLEYVLTSYTGHGKKLERIVGYADLVLETEIPQIYPDYKANPKGYGDDVFDGFVLGWSRRNDAPKILVEAKSVMPTVGELMRQINLYRTAFGGRFVVVSPDDTYAEILKEQGVTFVKYAP